MKLERSAGILLHPTSLPGRYGIGDLGAEAYNFVNFLEASGQTVWQVLPLGPTGYGDSPYQCFSAFAGNPYLISPDALVEEGLIAKVWLDRAPQFSQDEVQFGEVINFKIELLKKAYVAFLANGLPALHAEHDRFVHDEKEWLDDFALFMSLKDAHDGRSWNQWEPAIKARAPEAMARWTKDLAHEIGFYKFSQFLFFRQWSALKRYANGMRISIVGDLPIFIAFDSADAWAHKNLFTIGEDGTPLTVAGVPPDYFSTTGQLWGNPLYRWKEMEKDDFLWWRKRISKTLELVDIIRVDHFRGFDAYWEIPGDAETAVTGRWVKAPGRKFFTTIRKFLGDLPILAEDLGVITKSVRELRDEFNLPGMKILQFAFGTGMERRFLPHNHIENCVVYTGSHDNDTTRGYFEKAELETNNDIYRFAQEYLNYYGDDIRGALIKTAYASVAKMVVIPMQDVLNLNSEARMNFPGKLGGNWCWRFQWGQVEPRLAAQYKRMTELYERPPKPEKEKEIEEEE